MKNILLSILFLSFGCRAVVSQQPQSLVKKEFKVCGKTLILEIANNDQTRSMGLMYRQEVPAGTGMIFVFSNPQTLSFWMKNVPMDIDIAYFDFAGNFLNHYTMKGTSPIQSSETLASYTSNGKAKYAVEVEAGFYSKIQSLKSCKLSPLL